VAVSLLIVLTGTYAPFEYVDREARTAAGYGWIFSPPDNEALVNVTLLAIEWIGVLLAGGTLWLATSPLNRRSPLDNPEVKLSPEEGEMDGDSAPPAIAVIHDYNKNGVQKREGNEQKKSKNSRFGPRGIGSAYAAGFAVVVSIAVMSFLWREVRMADEIPPRPPSPEDLCHFAANTAMVEQWALADNAILPLQAAQLLFGPNARRSWTTEQAQELGDKTNLLRLWIDETPRVRDAIQSWTRILKTGRGGETHQRDYVRRMLVNHCVYG
jgi:hypothetical protein